MVDLEERDAQLALLEHTAARHAATLTDPEHRQALRTYATWGQLAGLRRRHPDGDTPPMAATKTHANLTAATRLLHELTARDLRLDTLRPAELDQ